MNDDKIFEAIVDLCFSKNQSYESAKLVDDALQADTIFHEHRRLLPLIYKRIKPELFSKQSWVKIESTYKHTYYRNRILADRAVKAQAALSKYIDTPLVFMKGMGLLLEVYDDLGERPMNDIDIFAPDYPMDGAAVKSHLAQQEKWHFRNDSYTAITYYDAQKFQYDIHRKINGRALANSVTKLVVKNKRAFEYEGVQLNFMCFEHQFVLVIYHGVLSLCAAYSKIWMVDALMLMAKCSLDPLKVIEFAGELDVPRVFLKGVESLLALPASIEFDREALKLILSKTRKKSWLCSWFISTKRPTVWPVKDKLSRLDMIKAAGACYVLAPLYARHWLSFSQFFSKALGKEDKWFLELFKRALFRSFHIVCGKWPKLKKN